MNNTWGRKTCKGQVLLLVFLLMILLGMIVGSAALMWELGLQSNASQSDSIRAFYLAEAGLNRAIDNIAQSGDDSDIPSTALGGGSYSVDIQANGAQRRKITSTGIFNNAKRLVFSEITNSTACPGTCPPYGNAWGYRKKGQNDWTEQ